MLRRFSVAVVLLSCAMTNSALSEDRFKKKSHLAAYEDAVGNLFDEAARQRLKNVLPKTTTEFAPSPTRFVIEADILATESEVDEYIASKSTASEAATDQTELIVHVANGNPAVWIGGARTICYSVVSATFPNESSYLQVVKDMQNSTSDWEKTCNSCDIDFDYISEHDTITTWDQYELLAATDKLRIIVVYNSEASGPIASAFFPNYPWNSRIVNVFPQYFTLGFGGYSARGVMRRGQMHVGIAS